MQAKYDATVHTARAVKLGVHIRANTVATFIESQANGRITGVRWRRPDGSSGRITARTVIVAANAMETPRLLLASASPHVPAGLANRSDQVGRNLMDHPIQLSWALTDKPVWPYRGPGSTSGIETLRTGSWRSTHSALRLEIGNDGWSWPTGAPDDTARRLVLAGLRGTELDRALRAETSRHVRLAALTEQLPSAENRVTLDPVLRDGSGLARPVIHYRIDDYTRAGFEQARRQHEVLFRHLGTTGVQHSDQAQGAGHILGTARMGAEATTSVVNAELRAHDHANLYLVGGATFPTSATANPTLTIAALALRAVDVIAGNAGG